MSNLLDIPALQPNDEIHHPLIIQDVIVRDGDHARTTLLLGNRTGKIESAPFWAGRDDMIRGLTRGTVVQVVGRVTSYRETRQLDATSVRPLPKGTIPLSDLMPSIGSTERYWKTIDDARGRLTAPRLIRVLDLLYADDEFRRRYDQCPGAPGVGHHAVIGGLLQHTCEVLLIARQIARVSHADEELVIAGVLLHDIGKLDCYRWETGVMETTERGRLVGHVVQGVNILRDAVRHAEPGICTENELLLLEHYILAHHGKYEYGSPVLPLTLEAQILNFADEASAKTASITEAYASRDLFPKADDRVAAKKVWQLDNRFLHRIAERFGRS